MADLLTPMFGGDPCGLFDVLLWIQLRNDEAVQGYFDRHNGYPLEAVARSLDELEDVVISIEENARSGEDPLKLLHQALLSGTVAASGRRNGGPRQAIEKLEWVDLRLSDPMRGPDSTYCALPGDGWRRLSNWHMVEWIDSQDGSPSPRWATVSDGRVPEEYFYSDVRFDRRSLRRAFPARSPQSPLRWSSTTDFVADRGNEQEALRRLRALGEVAISEMAISEELGRMLPEAGLPSSKAKTIAQLRSRRRKRFQVRKGD